MPNLIPETVRETLYPIYRARCIAAALWLIAGVFAIGALTLLPALFYLEAHKPDISTSQQEGSTENVSIFEIFSL